MLCLIIMTGCGSIAVTGINEPAKELKLGLEKVGSGLTELGKIDPLQLGKLLDENKGLQTQLAELQKRFNTYAPAGGIVVVNNTNRVLLRIDSLKGTFRIDAWVDTPSNWFLSNTLASSGRPSLDIKYNIAQTTINAVAQDVWSSILHKPEDGWMFASGCQDGHCQGHPALAVMGARFAFAERLGPTRAHIDTKYKDHVDAAFARFLESPYSVPTGQLRNPQAIDKRMLESGGLHAVYVRLTPMEAGPDGKWHIEFSTFTEIEGSEKREPISTIRVDSDTSEHQPTTAMPPFIAAQFYVRMAQ